MPAARARNPARAAGRPATIAIAALVVWMAALVMAVGPVAATDPTPTPPSSGDPGATPSPTPSPSPSPTPPPDPTVTFYGRGYGHGLGMSQYGARGRALAGQLAPEILAHYYQSTTLGSESLATTVRVLLVTGFKPTASTPARVVAHGGTWTVDGVTGTWPAGASATFVRVTSPKAAWQLRIVGPTGALLATPTVPSSVRIRPAATKTRLQVWFKPTYYDTYRGTIRLIGSSTGAVQAIDETTLELYLRGVVPCEMPSTWPTEALRAQAIAARSYAAAHLHPSTGNWDIYDDSRSQVYRGTLAEKSAASAAVVATVGQVLRSGSHVITAMFHSSDGGATEDNENVYVSPTGAIVSSPVPYLRGEPDRAPDSVAYDAAAPHATWKTATYTYAALSVVFESDPRTAVGGLTALDLSDGGVSGRLIRVTLIGSSGAKTVSGEVFRWVFNTYTAATDPYMWSTLVATAPIP